MQQRVDYLLAQGLSLEEVGRAVLAHPQVLHYKLDSMGERLAYLRSIGVEAAAAGACIARFPQLFSLNVEGNLAPKWAYLCDYILIAAPKEARVATLCAYPAYLSLSLTNRCGRRGRTWGSAGRAGAGTCEACRPRPRRPESMQACSAAASPPPHPPPPPPPQDCAAPPLLPAHAGGAGRAGHHHLLPHERPQGVGRLLCQAVRQLA